MVARWIEKPSFSDMVSNAQGTELVLHGKVVGTTDRNQAELIAAVNTLSTGFTIHGFIYRKEFEIVQVAYDQFDVNVSYGRKNEVGSYTFDFDTSGGTVHITQAKESIKRYSSATSEDGSAAATAIPKHFGSIGVDKDSVAGTDIVIPATKVNIRFRHPQAQITMAWVKKLTEMTGKVNSAAFLNWAAGEVLFLGAQGSDGSQEEATVGYSFAMSKNTTTLSIGAIANIAKKGWEYVWIKYKDDVSANAAARQPEFVYVERVYDEENFATQLGFG